ncbi:hypothetical protein [Moorena sp. SIO2C4]|nr:hypothetical protein [Moorena sp. SIO2C4]
MPVLLIDHRQDACLDAGHLYCLFCVLCSVFCVLCSLFCVP